MFKEYLMKPVIKEKCFASYLLLGYLLLSENKSEHHQSVIILAWSSFNFTLKWGYSPRILLAIKNICIRISYSIIPPFCVSDHYTFLPRIRVWYLPYSWLFWLLRIYIIILFVYTIMKLVYLGSVSSIWP